MTPAPSLIDADAIAAYRAARQPTAFQGCTQMRQFFVKADGTLSCSCMGYWNILADLRSIDAGTYFNGAIMSYIRESFAGGLEPFAFCGGCASRVSTFDDRAYRGEGPEYRFIDLHIEPSSQCNLYCEACLCTFERLSQNPPARMALDYALFEKLLREIQAAGLGLRNLALVGFGEPLFNPRTPDMARLARAAFPDAQIVIDTNANFGRRRAEELADCGVSEIRLALDGVDQDSYQAYRRNGSFPQALEFTRALAEAIRATGSPTKAVWKYILFAHNDSDDQIRRAMAMAGEIGIAIHFDATVGQNASARPMAEIAAITGQLPGCNIDTSATQGDALALGEPDPGTPVGRLLARFRRRRAARPPL